MVQTIQFTLNGQTRTVRLDPETPLLWVLRDALGLRGTKFGCGAGHCGACTVRLDGAAVRSCVLPVGAVQGKSVQSIEGVEHPITRVWTEDEVPQCGYCQSGQIMAALALIEANPAPSDADIDAAMQNLCRCGTYNRIRRAIRRTATLVEPSDPEPQGAP